MFPFWLAVMTHTLIWLVQLVNHTFSPCPPLNQFQCPHPYTCSFTLLCCGVWFVGGCIDKGVLVSPGLLHPEQQDIRPLHPCRQGQSEFPPPTPSDLTHKHIIPPSLCIHHIHHPLYIHPGHTTPLVFIPWHEEISKYQSTLQFTLSLWLLLPNNNFLESRLKGTFPARLFSK